MPDKPELDDAPDVPEEAADEVTDAPYDEAPPELPSHKADLVFLAIERGVPSYEAWDMTVPELTARLES